MATAKDFNSSEDALHHAAHSGYTHFTKVGRTVTVYGPGPDGTTLSAEMYRHRGKYHFKEPTVSKRPIPKRAKPIEHHHDEPSGSPPSPDHRVIEAAIHRGVSYKVYQDFEDKDGTYSLLIEGGSHNGGAGWHQDGYESVEDAVAAAKYAIDENPGHYGAQGAQEASTVEHRIEWHDSDDDQGEISVELSEDERDTGATIASVAAGLLKDEGAIEPSSTRFHPGVWYNAYLSQDPRTGKYPTKSFFLKGFTEAEQREVFQFMTQKGEGKRFPGSPDDTSLPVLRASARDDGGNIYWKDIPKGAEIIDTGSSYTAVLPDGTRKLVYWGGQDAIAAQRWLRSRAKRAPAGGGLGGMVNERLSYRDKQNLPASAFALPRTRDLPLTDKHGQLDERHVDNAAARLSMMKHEGSISHAEYEEARRRIAHARKKLGLPPSSLAHEDVRERGLVWLQRPDGVFWANATGGTFWLIPQPTEGDYHVMWTATDGDQKDLGVHPYARAVQVAQSYDPSKPSDVQYVGGSRVERLQYHVDEAAIRSDRVTNADIDQWIDNDEGLYNWWRSSRLGKREFIRDNREQLIQYIQGQLHKSPAGEAARGGPFAREADEAYRVGDRVEVNLSFDRRYPQWVPAVVVTVEDGRVWVTLPSGQDSDLYSGENLRHARGGAVAEAGRRLPVVEYAILIGPSSSADTLRLQQFLARNGFPFQFFDTEASGQRATQLIAQFHIQPTQLPALVWQGRVHARPSNREVADILAFGTQVAGEHPYDVVIIGAGPAGLSAGVYAASEGLSCLVVEAYAPGGQAANSSKIENYAGFPQGISGADLANETYKQAQKFGARFSIPSEAQRLIKHEDGDFEIRMADKSSIYTRAVILACGAKWRKPEYVNLPKFEGTGVYYAATATEAQYVKGQDVIVVGGGNSAGQAAMHLSTLARKVYLMVRGKGLTETMSHYLITRIEKQPNIELLTHTEIVRLQGRDHLERVTWKTDGKEHSEAVRHVFLMIGTLPKTDWLEECSPGTSWVSDCIVLDPAGFIKTGTDLVGPEWQHDRKAFPFETSMPGCFAVGDVRANSVKRVASAVGEGSVAISFVHKVIYEKQNKRAAQ